MKTLFLIFLLISITAHAATLKAPWGKDACLIKEMHTWQKAHEKPCSAPKSHLLQSLAVSAIWFHKKVISPADGPRSHFRPNSSQYTLDAIQKYGLWKGYLLGCDRLMRENPEVWIYPTITVENNWITKWDPVR